MVRQNKDIKNFEKKGVALVLGGGGSRGFFHIGVIKALRELKIPILEISGTSIGAILGAILAHDPDFDFDSILENFNFLKLIRLSHNPTSLISSKKIENYIRSFIKTNQFSKLKIPFSFVAVDINMGNEVIFRKGALFPGILASIAIPGIFPLVKIRNNVLCDGGLVNNVPVDLIQKKDIPMVISDVRLAKKKITIYSSKQSILFNTYLIPRDVLMNEKIDEVSKKRKIFHVNFHEHHHVLKFKKRDMQKIMQKGYDYVYSHKNKLFKIME